MTIDDQIKDEKLQYNINREAAKISALSHQVKIINASFLQVKKYYYLIKKRLKNKLILQILHLVKHLKNK